MKVKARKPSNCRERSCLKLRTAPGPEGEETGRKDNGRLMRKELGTRINLYGLALVKWKVASREELEKYNANLVADDFEYSLVSEFLR
jgi:hypothetical protein